MAGEKLEKLSRVFMDLFVPRRQGLKLQKIGVGYEWQTLLAANAVDNIRVLKQDALIDKHVFHWRGHWLPAVLFQNRRGASITYQFCGSQPQNQASAVGSVP
ncbi:MULTISPECIES: hypothetical protein [unclassified Pseudomonas]|uniref:hypothetical protein n=1 Tax=unclassified Pseudomonas TaxID=196821 RepID=UPI002AC955CA|nr:MULTISPECIES: hypothetical protein [unclassified Pseudomonas]MEB0048414.1 hypothetical protein [Pseudomonas sp. Dout3]MEB0099289.1 hypothetical protein [Pseudomonas sp. DC1.2]WPX57996.1 hypothetical protein RHM68_20695 [Pseudomonas sp. DC1.2]